MAQDSKPKAPKKQRTYPAQAPLDEGQAEAVLERLQATGVQLPKARYSREDVDLQLQFVLDSRADGFDKRAIQRGLRAKYPGLTRKRVDELWDRVTEIFVERSEKSLVERKEEQLMRLRHMKGIALLGQRDTANAQAWRHKPNLRTALEIEKLLAEIEGTLAPIQVNVNQALTAAMVTVVARLQGDEADSYLEEALEQKRLAELARSQLPALVQMTDPAGSVIDVDGIPSPEAE